MTRSSLKEFLGMLLIAAFGCVIAIVVFLFDAYNRAGMKP